MIFICGGAGNGNLGDELIVDAWLSHLTAAGSNEQIVVSGFHSENHEKIFADRYPGVIFTDQLNKLAGHGPKGFFASLRRGMNFFNNGGFDRYESLRKFSNIFNDMRIFHLHGGGYLNTLWPKNAFMLGFAVALKKRSGVRLCGTGLGMQPLPVPTGDNALLFAQAMTAFDVIETRDVESFLYVKAHGGDANVTFGQDDAFLHRASLSSREDRQGRWLHVSDFTGSGFTENILDIVGGARGAFERIVFWRCMARDDSCVALMREAGIDVDVLTMEHLLDEPLPVTVGDAMLTARFHPHLLAARLGADGFFRTDKSYYDVKHRSLVVNGSPFQDIITFPKSEVIARLEKPAMVTNFMSCFRNEKYNSKKNIADTCYK